MGLRSEVTGISSLADGTDQIFARAVTDLGGETIGAESDEDRGARPST